MMNQTVKRASIYEVYRDLIKLKMAIQLILTKDQYAALQYCGCSLKLDDDDNYDALYNNDRDILRTNQPEIKQQCTNQNLQINSKNLRKNKPQIVFENQKQHEIIRFDQDDLSNLSQNEEEDKDNQIDQNGIKIENIMNYNNLQLQSTQLPVSKRIIDPQLENQKNIFKEACKDQQLFESGKSKISATLQNHLSEIDKIEKNQQVKEKYLDIFIGRIRNNDQKNLSQVDKNIFYSLIGQNSNQKQM